MYVLQFARVCVRALICACVRILPFWWMDANVLARSITAARVNDRIFGLRTLGWVHSDQLKTSKMRTSSLVYLISRSVAMYKWMWKQPYIWIVIFLLGQMCLCVSVHIFSFFSTVMLHTVTRLIVSFQFDSSISNVAQKPACGKIVLRIYQWSPYNFCVLKSVRACLCVCEWHIAFTWMCKTMHTQMWLDVRVRECVSSSIHLHNRPRISIPFLVQKEKWKSVTLISD